MDRLKIEYVDINSIKPYKKNPRKNEEAIPYVEHYIDVIIQRWENFTGEKAIKLN